jgi:hypothetical protein
MAKKNKHTGSPAEEFFNEEEILEFTYDAIAFTPIFNEERKQYDMYCIKLNSETNEVELEIEECEYAEFHRASSDLNMRNINEMNRRLKTKGK